MAQILDINQDTFDTGNGLRPASNTQVKLAQSFTPSVYGQCPKVSLYLGDNGTTTGNVWVTIESDSDGKPSGTALATSANVDAAGIDSYGFDDFTFASPATLTNGTKYWIVLQGDYDYSGTNYLSWGLITASAIPNYGLVVFNGTVWGNVGTADFTFKTYYDDATIIIPSISYLDKYTDSSDLTEYTFSDISLGSPNSDRYIVVSAFSRKAGATFTLSSITIGGVSATITKQVTNTITNSDAVAIAIANVPEGTTGNIVVTWSTEVLRCAIGVWRITGLDSVTALDSDSSVANAPTCNLNVGIGPVIGAAMTAATTTTSWTNLTENYDANMDSAITYAGASISSTTAEALDLTATFESVVESAGVFASWLYSTTTSTSTTTTSTSTTTTSTSTTTTSTSSSTSTSTSSSTSITTTSTSTTTTSTSTSTSSSTSTSTSITTTSTTYPFEFIVEII